MRKNEMCGRGGCNSPGIHQVVIEREDGFLTVYSCSEHKAEAEMAKKPNNIKITGYHLIPKKEEKS